MNRVYAPDSIPVSGAALLLNRVLPSCLKLRVLNANLAELCDADSDRLDLVDEELGTVHRDVMAKTAQEKNYTNMSSTSNFLYTN